MNIRRLTAFLAITASLLFAASSSAGNIDALLASYFETQTALSKDDFSHARFGATSLAIAAKEKADALPAGMGEKIRDAARELAFAPEIGAARKAFATLSEQLIALASDKQSNTALNAVRMHCSMAFDNKGGDWLQNTDSPANPYFGASMFACGSSVAHVSSGQIIAASAPASQDSCCSEHASEAKSDACCSSSSAAPVNTDVLNAIQTWSKNSQ